MISTSFRDRLMKLMSLIVRVVTYVFAIFGGLMAAALVGVFVVIPKALPEPTVPINYPFGAYPIGGEHPSFPPDFGQARDGKPGGEPYRLLVISEGGQGGAYGAGVLVASAAAKAWPSFDIYTGVSVGALLATMAFVDRVDHADIKPIVEEIANTIERDADRSHLLDVAAVLLGRGIAVSHDIEAIIRKTIDREIVERIAKRHAAGQRLYVVSADLTTGSPVLWDLGAIAARPATNNVARIQEALLASIGVPLIFPSQIITADGDQTLQVDGGIMRPFYISDHFIKLSLERPFEVHFLVNIKLNSPPRTEILSPRIDSIMHRLIYLILRAQTDSFLERLLLDTILYDWVVRVASIPAHLPDVQASDEMTASGISSAFETAYRTTHSALEKGEGLGAVWVPLTPRLIGRNIPCAPDDDSCQHDGTASSQ